MFSICFMTIFYLETFSIPIYFCSGVTISGSIISLEGLTAQQSSVKYGLSAYHAIDASLETFTHTDDDSSLEDYAWWGIDLEQDTLVQQVTIVNRNSYEDGNGQTHTFVCDRLRNVRIGVADDFPSSPTPMFPMVLCAYVADSFDCFEEQTLNCTNMGVTGRYLIIQLGYPGSVLTICDVKIKGDLIRFCDFFVSHCFGYTHNLV